MVWEKEPFVEPRRNRTQGRVRIQGQGFPYSSNLGALEAVLKSEAVLDDLRFGGPFYAPPVGVEAIRTFLWRSDASGCTQGVLGVQVLGACVDVRKSGDRYSTWLESL